MSDRPDTPLLDRVNFPADIRELSKDQLPQLADELRQEVISAVSVTGGHLGAGLGDGALSAGMAYEAMNNAAAAGNRLVVILNDNDMSIAPPVGSMRNALARLVSSSKYLTPRRLAQKLARAMPDPLHRSMRRMEEYTRGWLTGGTLFEEPR